MSRHDVIIANKTTKTYCLADLSFCGKVSVIDERGSNLMLLEAWHLGTNHTEGLFLLGSGNRTYRANLLTKLQFLGGSHAMRQN